MIDAGAGRARSETRRRRAVQPLWTALDHHLAPHLGGGALLCVSGGPDSSALLEAAGRWAGRLSGALEVASVDHGHRVGAAQDADRTAARARALGFEAHVVTLVGGRTGEGALRDARYGHLLALARSRGLGALVVAHHRDDEAEGFLLDALGWGGGAQGAAMDAVQRREGVLIVRPFLGLARMDLRLALSALDAPPPLTDPDDARERGRRARLRARGLPALAALDGRAGERLAAKAGRRREDEEALRAAARAALEHRGDGYRIRADVPAAILRRAVELGIRELASERDPRAAGRTLDLLLSAASAGQNGRSYDLPGVVATLTGGQVHLKRRDGPQAAKNPTE